MVVDVDDDVRRFACIALEMDGRFSVVEAMSSTSEAVEVVSRHQPDAVVLALTGADGGLGMLGRLHAAVPSCRLVVFNRRTERDPERPRDVVAALLRDDGTDPRVIAGVATRDAAGVASAEALVRDACIRWGRPDLSDPAGRLAAALVSGVERSVAEASPVEIAARLRDGTVRVAVSDAQQVGGAAEAFTEVGSLAGVWGIDPCLQGRLVWAEAHSGVGSGPAVPEDLSGGTAVEVQSLYDGRWTRGFVVERSDDVGYWLKRVDESRLPAPIRRRRVRASDHG